MLNYFLSYYIQKNVNYDFYAIIDITNKSKQFFKTQTLVNFSKIWFYHDHVISKTSYDKEYLQNFEKKYGINLWELSLNERIFNFYNEYYKFSSDEILSILYSECKFFEQVLLETNPSHLIIRETALHHDYLFHKICKKLGIRILMLNQSKFGYKCILSEELHFLDDLQTLENIEYSGRTFDELQNYLKSLDYSKQLISYKNNIRSSKYEMIKAAINFLLTPNSNIKTHYTYYGRTKIRVICKEILSGFKKRIRERYINKNLHKIVPDEKYILFTLHMEPERSLLLAAPLFTNQLEIIRIIAKSIPVGYKLLVKEHYSQSIRDWRELSFYKIISKIPNVILIHPSTSIEKLIQKSSLVISIGGSVSFEACFYEKPSIIFADLGYKIINSITKINNIEDLSKQISESLYKKPKIEDLDRYVVAMDDNSFEFDLWNFQLKFLNEFFYGGRYVDVEISESKIRKFLDKESDILNSLAIQYIKKINSFKK